MNSNELIETKISHARNEARILYAEVEAVKQRLKDKDLKECSTKINNIPSHSINPKLYNTLEGHQNKISRIQWNKEGNHILSASQDGFMILWDSVTGYKKRIIELENQWVLTCALSPDNSTVASAGLDNNLTIYPLNNSINPYSENRPQYSNMFESKVQSILKGHRAYISDCKFINDDQVITGSGDMKNIMWDLRKEGKVREFIEHSGDILCLDAFPATDRLNSNLFISGGCDGYCKVWDLRMKSSAQSLFISNYDINSVKIFPQGQSIITGLDNGVIKLFDLRSDCEISSYSILNQYKRFQGGSHTSLQLLKTASLNLDQSRRSSMTSVNSFDSINILSIEFSKSGRLIYSCYSDFGCLIWDTLKSEIIGSIGGHMNKINQVSVAPDGIGICTASWDSTIKVWAP